VFVDTSLDSTADFQVADTFHEEPTREDLNSSIIEFLEGSEREDDLVAQQMQKALEEGQLDRILKAFPVTEEKDSSTEDYVNNDDDNQVDDNGSIFYNDFEFFEEDSC